MAVLVVVYRHAVSEVVDSANKIDRLTVAIRGIDISIAGCDRDAMAKPIDKLTSALCANAG
ncbi:hypothetical protein WMF45_37970 [Sorangium sp. So ce448]|uniref:hypothetical protein n=1 Tax=Sorangium sp. So ce448 TaxID=3133314 RepID=UPI003F613EB9